jgi:sterol desaturase/sphingolipid hydroxylase (fatty acid hydroxylase superfamily)
MHRIHHQRGRHYSNCGDLPLWDMLFGTYKNPDRYDGLCGFKTERELALGRILAFDNVNGPMPPRRPA